MNKPTPTRYKLLKTFFWAVRQAGISEDDWRAMIENLYQKDSLRLLTTDELKQTIDEVVAKTGVTLRKPLPKQRFKREDMVVMRNGKVIELPTRDQLAMIEFHADKMLMSQETLQHLIKKIDPTCPTLNFMAARTLIEVLKAMHARGWKEKPAADPAASAGKGH